MKYSIQVKVKNLGWWTAMHSPNLKEIKRKTKALVKQGHEVRFTKMGVITNVCD